MDFSEEQDHYSYRNKVECEAVVYRVDGAEKYRKQDQKWSEDECELHHQLQC